MAIPFYRENSEEYAGTHPVGLYIRYAGRLPPVDDVRMHYVHVRSQSNVCKDEDEFKQAEFGEDETVRNKVRLCLRYGEETQGFHFGAGPEELENPRILHPDRSVTQCKLRPTYNLSQYENSINQ